MGQEQLPPQSIPGQGFGKGHAFQHKFARIPYIRPQFQAFVPQGYVPVGQELPTPASWKPWRDALQVCTDPSFPYIPLLITW